MYSDHFGCPQDAHRITTVSSRRKGNNHQRLLILWEKVPTSAFLSCGRRRWWLFSFLHLLTVLVLWASKVGHGSFLFFSCSHMCKYCCSVKGIRTHPATIVAMTALNIWHISHYTCLCLLRVCSCSLMVFCCCRSSSGSGQHSCCLSFTGTCSSSFRRSCQSQATRGPACTVPGSSLQARSTQPAARL